MGESFVVYDNDTSTLHEINETGYTILKGIEDGRKKEEILKNLAKVFKVEKERATKDYEEFVDLLEKKDLIEK